LDRSAARTTTAGAAGGGWSRTSGGFGSRFGGPRLSAAQTVALVPELGEHRAEGDIERTRYEQSRYGTDPVGAVDHEDEHDEHDEDVDDPLPNETPPRDRSSRIPRHAFVLAALTRSIRLVRVGVLTGGGDCPGLNAVIRAIVRKGERVLGDDVVGFLDAWDGVMDRRTMPLTVESMRGSLPRGGTVLGTRRGSPLDHSDGVERVRSTIHDLGLDGIIVIGGNGSLTVAEILYREHGIPVLGVPKTIDNDIVGTDLTFGFNTAVQIATDAIDRLHTTAESHDRVMVVEVMGRNSGWIATHAGIAGGATVVLVPEHPFDIDQVCERLTRRHSRGRYASIVVVAEGAVPAEGSLPGGPDPEVDRFGHAQLGGIGHIVADEIGRRTGFETRPVLLGHVQRGGTPTAFDRVLSTRFGVAAIDAVHAGAWGSMVALRGSEIVTVPLAEAAGRSRPVDLALFTEVAEIFFA